MCDDCLWWLSRELFASLDRCEEILSKQKFIAGDVLTEADIRLFMTLIRFDHVYALPARLVQCCQRVQRLGEGVQRCCWGSS